MPAQVDYNCSETMCVGPYYKSKYKTLRAASVLLGTMHRQKLKQDTKNWQRVVQFAADIILSADKRKNWPEITNPEIVDMAYKLRSLALETIRERQ